jgi:hypothetical protein
MILVLIAACQSDAGQPAEQSLPEIPEYLSEEEAVEAARGAESWEVVDAYLTETRLIERVRNVDQQWVKAWAVTFQGVQIEVEGPVPAAGLKGPALCFDSWRVFVDAVSGDHLRSGNAAPPSPCKRQPART